MINTVASPNSAAPTTSQTVGGVYNQVAPVLSSGQAAPFQFDINGKLLVNDGGGGGGLSAVNITEILSNPVALSNPLPVELSDGTNPFGTVGNPIHVTGGGSGDTQYVDETAETAGAFTGTVALGYNGTDVVGLRLDPSNNLLVDLATAIPTGGNLIGQVEVSDGTNTLFTSGHPGYVQFGSTPSFTGNITQWDTTALGAPTGFGTAPSGNVIGVNADVLAAATYMTGTTPGTAPASTEVIGGIYNSSAPAPTTGQTLPIQVDGAGNTKTVPGLYTQTLAVWNSANFTPGFSAVLAKNTGCPAVLIQFNQAGSFSSGGGGFQGTFDGLNWVTLNTSLIFDPTSQPLNGNLSSSYTFTTSNKPFLIMMGGYQQIRFTCFSQAIVGAGVVTPFVTQLPVLPYTLAALTSALNTTDSADMVGQAPSFPPYSTLITGGVYNSSPPSPTNGQTLALQQDAAGNLFTDVNGIAGSTVAIAATGVQKVGVVGNTGATFDAAINSGPAPTNAVWDSHAPVTVAAGALTPIAITSTAQKVLKASAGNLYGLHLVSLNVTTTTTGVLYVHFFNTTTTTSLSTGSWIGSLPIPSPESASTSAHLSIPPGSFALMNFSTGITIVVSTTSTSNTTAGGTGVVGTFFIE